MEEIKLDRKRRLLQIDILPVGLLLLLLLLRLVFRSSSLLSEKELFFKKIFKNPLMDACLVISYISLVKTTFLVP